MPDLILFLQCYVIGVLGNLSLGPIFLLTFNRSAYYGARKGLAIAIGASLADALLFMLGLTGALSLLESIASFQGAMYAVGLFVLGFLGYKAIVVKHVETRGPNLPARSLPLVSLKAFFMTLSNPLTIIYFMGASVSLLNRTAFSSKWVGMSSMVVGLGTFSVLALVSVVAKIVGHRISERILLRVSHIAGVLFLSFSGYFAYLLACTIKALLY